MGYVAEKIAAYSRKRLLPDLARARLEALDQEQKLAEIDWHQPVVDLVRALSPGQSYESPSHLAPYGEQLDLAPGSGLRLVLAAPPQYGKTETTKAGLLKAAMRFPAKYVYATYNQTQARTVSDALKHTAEEAGIKVLGTKDYWRLPNGSTIKWTSIGGSLTGNAVTGGLIVDDPFKDEKSARSTLMRNTVDEWLERVGLTRVHPGAWVILMATRWHEDDLSGRCVKKRGWRYLNLQAIADGPIDEAGRVIADPLHRFLGEPLWPSKRPLSFLKEAQKNEWTWNSLYQGTPRPKGAKLFKTGSPRFDELPPGGRHVTAHGVDLAYSEKKSSDFSVCLTGRKYGKLIYVTGIRREQVTAPIFCRTLSVVQRALGGRMRWYLSGTEMGSAAFITEKVKNLVALAASEDKYMRAQPASEKWNDGEILLPSEGSSFFGPWVQEFLDEVTEFTGCGDPQDDQVDGLASLVDELLDSVEWVEDDQDLPPQTPIATFATEQGKGF